MNLEDVVNPEYGLQIDDWSIENKRFGQDKQLVVIGWCDKRKTNNKMYLVKCEACSLDPELYGDGYFKATKGNLKSGRLPCGCSRIHKWSKDQYSTLCHRVAQQLGYEFIGFEGDWLMRLSKVVLKCKEHGEWATGNIKNLLNSRAGCPECANDAISKERLKPDEVMIQSFFASECFHPETKFWRSERLNSYGYPSYWYMSCPECSEIGEAFAGGLQNGQRPCACSKHRQREAYINFIVDSMFNVVAIKFGISVNSRRRVENQNRKSIYTVVNYCVYEFPDKNSCAKAERDCKELLFTGVLSKQELPDGWTETTHKSNLIEIEKIYKMNGGQLK